MSRAFLILLLFVLTLTPASTVAQSQATTPVLIPVFFAGPGAFGSFWNTQLTILNNSVKPLTSIPYIYECPIPEGCLSAIPAHASVAFTAGAPNCPACFRFSTGFFYSIRSDELPQAILSLPPLDEAERVAEPVDRGLRHGGPSRHRGSLSGNGAAVPGRSRGSGLSNHAPHLLPA